MQEGSTFGTDATSELKRRLMAENRQKFFSKWRAVLEVRYVAGGLQFADRESWALPYSP